jgi:hypothetical protein
MSRFLNLRAICCAGMMLILGAFGACSTVSANSGPSATPPTIQWNIRDTNTNATQQLTGNQTLTATVGDTYQVTVHGLSPSGVQTLSVGRGASWTCTSGDVGQNRTADFVTDTTSQTPDSTGGVLDDIFLIESVDLSMDCESGFTFSGGGYSLDATASNFAHQTVNATLAFNVSP